MLFLRLVREVQYKFHPCRAPHAEVRSEYSRRQPGFLETLQKTPLPGAMQPSTRSLTAWLGGYYFGTIPGTLSVIASLVCIHVQ